jgi:hypothetical protein
MSSPLLEKEQNITTGIVFDHTKHYFFLVPERSVQMIVTFGNTSIVLQSLTPVILFLVLTYLLLSQNVSYLGIAKIITHIIIKTRRLCYISQNVKDDYSLLLTMRHHTQSMN